MVNAVNPGPACPIRPREDPASSISLRQQYYPAFEYTITSSQIKSNLGKSSLDPLKGSRGRIPAKVLVSFLFFSLLAVNPGRLIRHVRRVLRRDHGETPLECAGPLSRPTSSPDAFRGI